MIMDQACLYKFFNVVYVIVKFRFNKKSYFSTVYAINRKINISCAEIVILERRILPIHSGLLRENFHACLKNRH